jgi:hypothetical protein
VAKRVSLHERRAQDQQGFEKFFTSPSPPKPTAEKLMKATYYIRLDQDIALASIQLAERQRSGRRCDKSELVREALDLLMSKYSVPVSQ